VPAALVVLMAPVLSAPLTQSGIDPEALIERILAVDQKQRSEISDLVFDAEYIEGKRQDDGSFKEEKRFVKKIYLKYLPDTVWYHEEYLEYYQNGELQTSDKRDKEAAKRLKKKKKRKLHDISYPMLRPFYPEYRDRYEITYEGIVPEKINGYVCHHFRVTPKEEAEDLIKGDFYFEAESFHLVRVDFSPAKLVKKTMFRLKRLDMSILYGPTPDGFWLPRQFDIEGSGRAAFLFGVRFAGTEYYRHPQVNSGVKAEIFEEDHD
jgi:hypothetical protein